VAFAPATVGATSGSIAIGSTVPTGEFTPGTLSFSGSGTAVPAVLMPDAMTFAEIPAFTTSPPQLLTLANADAAATLTVTGYTFQPAQRYAVVSGGSCPAVPFTIAAGGFCTAAVAFTPMLATGGVLNATLTVQATPSTNFVPASVMLNGTGGPDNTFRDGFETP
jgi:hypothetical protein